MNNSISSPCVHDTRTHPDCIALLLSGGDGTRLRDLTQEIEGIPIPKQYCRLYNNASLLEATLARTRLYTQNHNINIIMNRNHINLAMEQVYGLPEANILIQPENRDTGPGLIFSLLQLKQKYPDGVVAVFPTDHYIDNDKAFITHVLRATRLITRIPDKIAVLGIAPDRPETGYGYLLPDSPVGTHEKAYHVKAFSEKPDLQSAYEIIRSGGLWNTFVMVFKLSRMMDILNQIFPDRVQALSKLIRFPHESDKIYRDIVPWNFSTQVLTRIPQHIVMLEIDNVCWSDWGTRELIERTYRSLNRIPFWKHPLHRQMQPRRDSADHEPTSQFIA